MISNPRSTIINSIMFNNNKMATRRSSSVSSEEVILFQGRNHKTSRAPKQRLPISRINSNEDIMLEDYIANMDLSSSDSESSSEPENSSPGKKNKGKQPVYGVDSDMERELALAFKNDRKKKKERRREREKLHAQGLIGASKKKKKKNTEHGVSGMVDFTDQMKEFLASDRQTIHLPAMTKTKRKLVHEIAHNFNIKSNSRGQGMNRHPVLNKTKRTRPYSDAAFEAITHRLLKRFKANPGWTEGGQVKKQFSYREGDVVGSNAAELGTDNRGHAMLAKMGWSKGDALGAINNPGILDPITSVIRSGKAGLG